MPRRDASRAEESAIAMKITAVDLASAGLVDEVVYDGTLRMREEARATLSAAKKAMGMSAVWNRISRKAEDARKKRERSGQA